MAAPPVSGPAAPPASTDAEPAPPTTVSDTQTTQQYATAPVDPTPAEAAREMLGYLSDGNLTPQEIELMRQLPGEILEMLDNGTLPDLSEAQQTQITTAVSTGLEPENQSQSLADGTRLSERITERDRTQTPGRDGTHNFFFDTPAARRGDTGFFAEQASHYREMAQQYGTEQPQLAELASRLENMYQTLAQSTATRPSQREAVIQNMEVAILEAQTALTQVPPEALPEAARTQISDHLYDMASIVNGYENYAGRDIGGFNAPTALDRFASSILQRQREFQGTAHSGRRQPTERTPATIQGALASLQMDRESMQIFIGRNRSLESALQNGQYRTRQSYIDAVIASAPGTSQRFKTALTQLGNAQYDAYEARQAATAGASEARQGRETASQALDTVQAAQTEVQRIDADLQQVDRLLTEYEQLRAQSQGHTERAQGLLARAERLQSSAQQRLGQVRNSAFGSALSSQIAQTEGRLRSISPLMAQIRQDNQSATATLQEGDRVAGETRTQRDVVEAQRQAELEAQETSGTHQNEVVDLNITDFEEYIGKLDSESDSITLSIRADGSIGPALLRVVGQGQLTMQITRLADKDGEPQYAVQFAAEGQLGVGLEAEAARGSVSGGGMGSSTYVLNGPRELNHFLINQVRDNIPFAERLLPNLSNAPEVNVEPTTKIGGFAQLSGEMEFFGRKVNASGRAQQNWITYPDGSTGKEQILTGSLTFDLGADFRASGVVTRSSVSGASAERNQQRLGFEAELQIPLAGSGATSSRLRRFGSRAGMNGVTLDAFVERGVQEAQRQRLAGNATAYISVKATWDVNTDEADLVDSATAPIGSIRELRVGAGVNLGGEARFNGGVVRGKVGASAEVWDYSENLVES